MKHYVTRRKPLGAAQWNGELTPEVRELLGERNVTVDGDLLTLGNGAVADVGDWIYQVFLERDDSRVPLDLAVMNDVQFRALYEALYESAPTREEHDKNYHAVAAPVIAAVKKMSRAEAYQIHVFVKDLDALLVDGLMLSPEAHADVFKKRTLLLRLRHDLGDSLIDDERYHAQDGEKKRVMDKILGLM